MRLGIWNACSVLVLLVLSLGTAAAQQIDADEIYLGTQRCRIISGSTTPEGNVTGPVCSLYLRTSDGMVWRKATGTGNTGWVVVAVSIPVTVPEGGTGRTTLTSNGVLYGAGTANVGMTAAPPANSVLTGNAGAPSFSATPTVTSLTATTSLLSPLVSVATGDLTLRTLVGDLVLDPAGRDVLPITPYSVNIGLETRKYLTLHSAELRVGTLIAADYMSTIGGRLIVAPSTRLAADLAAGVTTISVEHNNLASGDHIIMEAGGKLEFMLVASGPSGAGPFTYTVTRNMDGSGSNAWSAGDSILNTGTTGDGFIDIYADSGVNAGTTVGPTLVGNVRTGTGFNDYRTRWAAGNLNNVGYGHATDVYGFAAGVTNAETAGPNFFIDPVNGLHLRHGTVPAVSILPNGTVTIRGEGSGMTNINGGNIQTDTITATQIAANAITATEIAANAVTADKIIAGAVSSAKISSGTGSNMLRNSECRTGTWEWTGYGYAATAFSYSLAGWRLLDEDSTCYAAYTGSPTGTGSIFVSKTYPVVASRKYEASIYFGVHRLNAHVLFEVFDSTGTSIGYYQGNDCLNGVAGTGGPAISGYCRSGVIAQVPAAAVSARVWAAADLIGVANPYMFWVRAYFGEAKDNQTELSEWSPAGLTEITGGEIRSDVITATHIGASAITASELAAGSVSAGHIVAGTITATQIAAGTITADRMNVTTLSAITADMGTVTAGTINGVTVNFSGGTLNNTQGLRFSTAGNTSDFVRSVSWDSGATINGQGSYLHMRGPGGSQLSQINLYGGYLSMWADSNGADTRGIELDYIRLYPMGNGSHSLGRGAYKWDYALIKSTIHIESMQGGGNRHVCVDNSGDFYPC